MVLHWLFQAIPPLKSIQITPQTPLPNTLKYSQIPLNHNPKYPPKCWFSRFCLSGTDRGPFMAVYKVIQRGLHRMFRGFYMLYKVIISPCIYLSSNYQNYPSHSDWHVYLFLFSFASVLHRRQSGHVLVFSCIFQHNARKLPDCLLWKTPSKTNKQ